MTYWLEASLSNSRAIQLSHTNASIIWAIIWMKKSFVVAYSRCLRTREWAFEVVGWFSKSSWAPTPRKPAHTQQDLERHVKLIKLLSRSTENCPKPMWTISTWLEKMFFPSWIITPTASSQRIFTRVRLPELCFLWAKLARTGIEPENLIFLCDSSADGTGFSNES